MQPVPSATSAIPPQPVPVQRGNPRGIRARATDHAVRRFSERAIGIWVGAELDDAAALAELRQRGVEISEVRKTLSKLGGIGVANGAQAVVVNGLKLVIRDGAVVTVLAKNQVAEVAALPDEPFRIPAPPPRRRTILHRDYPGHD